MNSFPRLIIVLVSFVFIISCKKDDLPSEDNKLTLADNTVIVDADKLSFVSSEDDVLVLRKLGDGQSINVDDIIVSEQNGGLILHVDNVEYDGDLIKINTSQSYLNKAVKQLKYNNEYDFNIGSSNKKNTEVKLKKGVSVFGENIILKGVSLFKNSAGARIEITDGKIEFNPSVYLDIEIGFFELLEFETYAKGDVDFDLEVLITSSADMKKKEEVVLASFVKTEVQFIGAFPVAEIITLEFIAGYELDHFHNVDVSTGFESSYSVKVGANYEKGYGWNGIWDRHFNFTMHPFELEELSIKTDVKIYVRPKLTVKLYGLAGPGIDMRPYLNFIGNAEKVSSTINWDWMLRGGIDAHLLFVLGFIDGGPEFSHELLDTNVLIASDSGSDVSFKPLPILKLTPETGDVTTNFMFDGSLTTDKDNGIEELEFRFDINGDGAFESSWQRDPKFQGNYGQYGKGNYSAVMEVRDPKGEKSTAEKKVVIFQ